MIGGQTRARLLERTSFVKGAAFSEFKISEVERLFAGEEQIAVSLDDETRRRRGAFRRAFCRRLWLAAPAGGVCVVIHAGRLERSF